MNRITELFKINLPIVQAGMIWCSGWELASAVSNAGGLGLIGSGSMNAEILKIHITKCKNATDKPFGVNIPLLFQHSESFINMVIEEKVPIVFTSAGSPSKYTSRLKEHGITVVHVVANTKFARKCEDAGVDAIVAEGFEAGGHNGIEETTTMTLIPMVRDVVKVPLIAAGGIANGRSMLAAFALGAEGVQVGTRFVASVESSAHAAFKQALINSKDGDTMLAMRKVVPVRLLKNKFYNEIKAAEDAGANPEELMSLLGHSRSRKGMFDGDLEEGELEIGQVSGLIKEIIPAALIVDEMMKEFALAKQELAGLLW
jgi:enoyl-[acyl-carrier protein] reductase II